MVERASTTTTHAMMMVIQEKTWLYIEQTSGMTSFPLLLLLKHMGVFILIFIIFDRLCTDHYRLSSTIFFSPLDGCFLLSTSHVHNLITCANHNDLLASYYRWLRFLISSTHYSYYTFVTTWFVANDNFFILGFLCYHWLSFGNHESPLHTIFTLFLLIICFCFFSLGCVYLCSHLPCTFDGWVPILDFYLQGFSSFLCGLPQTRSNRS
jgi:hypothetical protein